ncbi:MAG: hypothetical protein RTV72_08465 [Candidatus Thorarchaeota archaeon]
MKRTTKYSLVSFCIVVVFLMAPIATQSEHTLQTDHTSDFQFRNDMNIAADTTDYVDSSTSDIDSSSDIGTHSSFASQQAGPDSTYDTLTEANGDPPPTNTEDDIDSDTSNVDSTSDIGIEGTFSNAQGSALDSNYFVLQEEGIISPYGGETGGVFVTGSVPDMAGKDQFAFYQAIFWNPTDDVYEVSRVEFSYTGSQWLNAIAQGSGLSYPTSEWGLTNKQVAYWAGSTPITVQPHTASSFYVRGDSNRVKTAFYIDIRITANSSTYVESYHSQQNNKDRPAAQLWLGSSLPPTQIHSVSTGVQTTVSVSLEEDANQADILSGGTLTIDVPSGFTGITDVGGTNWGAATIIGSQITVSNTAAIRGSYLTYAFQITSPSIPGLYKLDIAFDDGTNAHPIGNFTIHVTGVPPTVEKINLEYQWTTATYDESFENISIYVGSHTGSENLAVNYWDGFTWNALGIITAGTTGWANFTATGLSSSTYTIQLLGTSESSDSSKDTWNIDLITLHTWSLQTYNYKLDLEIQWSSANYTQDFEELCIYTGNLDTESIRIDIWNGADWTNIATDLNADSWNNISIGTWLTSATLTIRFRGDLEVGDTSQSSWEIDCSLLHTWDNEVPTNSATPVISNLDDTTFLYAEYRQYQLTAEVTDLDGYAEIDYVELTLTSNDELTEYWSIRYDEDTNLFTEQSDPSDYITLNTSSSGAVEAGNTISATFFITVNWDHPDVVNTHMKSEVFDANPSSSSDYFDVNWDIETRLDLSSGPSLTDGFGTSTRGDLDGSMTASGLVTYLGSALHPSAADVDVWISSSEYGTQTGPWEATNYEDVGGTFSATVYADDQVGIDDYTFKAVTEGAGASGGDHFSASQTQQYLADVVQVQSYSSDDSRINVNTTASLHAVLYYAYDGSFVIDGSVTINGITASYSGSDGIWDFIDEQSTAQLVTYDTLVYSGGVHGITGEDQNGQSVGQIWDYVKVVSYSAVDARVDVNSNAIIDVILVYEYDSSFVIDGSVTINGASATNQGVGVWRITVSNASVQGITYNLVVVSGNAHGITLVDQNGQSQLVIWDRVIVTGYSIADNRVTIDDSVNLDVSLAYEYDSAPVTDGSVTINLVSASHTVGGVWRITVSKSTVQGVNYNSVACSGNAFGISAVNQNSQSQLIIWDQITVRSYSVSDYRVNVDDSVNIDVTLEYEYDDSDVENGTVTINGNSASYLGGGVWRIVDTEALVQLNTYNSVTCSGNTLGISSVNQNSQSVAVIWDQITVRSYTVIDSRVNIDDSVNIDVTLEYEYDDSPVIDGIVTINGNSATNMSGGVWRISQSRSSVQEVTFGTVICSGNAFDISNVNQNSQSAIVVWDLVVVRSYSVQDARVDISTVVTINFTLEYESDDTPVVDRVVTLNGVSASHVIGGVWQITQSRSSVQNVTYNNVQCSNNLHGINGVDQNSQSQDIIWDQITVRLYVASDNRVNLDDSVSINVTLEYEFDDSDVEDGTVTINGNVASYEGNGVWSISQSRSSVLGVTYDSVACFGNTHGISNVNQNGQSQLVIWDQITVRGYEVSDLRDNVGDPITITVELEFEYDDSDVTDASVTINSLSFTYTGSLGKWSASRIQASVGNETFAVVLVSDNTHGISDVNQNGQSQTVIWDRIQVLTTLVDDGRINTDSSCEIRVTLMLEYDSTLLGVGDTVTVNGVSLVWDGIDLRFEGAQLQSSVGEWVYFVNSSLETTYGISALNVNSQEISVIWDQIRILTTVVDDGRVSIGSSVELRVTAVLVFDGHPLGAGDSIVMDSASMTWDGINTWFDLSRMQSTVGLWNFEVDSASEVTHGITAVDLNGTNQDVIWDRLSVYIVADMDSVANGIQVNFTMTVTYEYDLGVCTIYSLKVARNNTHWHTFTNANVTLFYDTNSDLAYLYNVTIIDSETTYEITIFSTNIETVEWGAGTTAPVNDAAPVLTNPDDSSFMYARLNFYIITSNVSDAEGFADISYVELSLWDNSRSTEIWRIRFTESTNTFSIELGSEYIQLGSGCTYTKSGFNIDITWSIKIDWDHQDLSNIDFKQYVIDSGLDSDENWYEVDYDVETRLDYSLAPSLSDDRGDLSTNDLECSGTVVYYGSLLHPLANETDVWVSHDISGDWTSNLDISGAFTVSSIASSDLVRLNNYTIKIVSQGNGSSGTDLYYTASETNEFITDRIEFYLSGAYYDRVNVNDGGVPWLNARYDYDDVEITADLTAQLNGSKTLMWDNSLSRWYFVDVLADVGQIGYGVASASESGYGLSGWIQTASNVTIIWDKITVRSYTAIDTRTNVSDFAIIDVLLEYEYDDSFVEDGTVEINSVLAVYQGSGIWRISDSRSSVVLVTYDSISCSGNVFNITNVDQNAQTIDIIWDRILVNSYSVADNRVNINDIVNIDVTLTFEYDGSFVIDGSVTINGFSASPLGLGVWRITQSRSTIQSFSFNSVNCSGNINDIALVDQNGQSQDVIWDQIIVQSYTVLDNRINVDDSAIIDFVLHYDYDDSDVADGSVSINAIAATYQGSGIWRITDTQSSVLLVNYSTVVCSGNSFDISSVNQNGQSEFIIWDQIIVVSYSVDYTRVDLNTVVVINVTLEYGYDSTSVVNGVVIVQSVSAMHVGTGIWQISLSKSSVQMVSFDTVVCSDITHGISNVNQSGQQLDVIWDKITVRSYTVTDSRVNVGDSVDIDVLIEYEYDDSPVTDGTVTINGISAADMGAGVWRISNSESTVQFVTYNVIACSENLHGISTIDQNSQSHTVIWDRIVVISYQVLDPRVDIDTSVNVDVVLEYEFDNTDVTNGSVQINGIEATYLSGGIWRISDAESTVGLNTYSEVTCSGNTHGISAVDQNGQSIQVIWDQITVRSLTASDDRISIGSTITVYITLEYEYDDSDVTDGSVIVNSITFTYTGSNGEWSTDRLQNSVTSETYDSSVASGNEYAITSINQTGLSLTIIWDRIRILTTTVDNSRLNTDATARIMVTAELEYDGHLLESGDTLVLGGSAMNWDNGNGWFYLDVSQSAVGLWNYYVNSTGATEDTYGISEITTVSVSQDVIWDQLSITLTPDSTSVDDYDVVSFTLDVTYVYDSSPCTSYVLEISRDGTYWLTFTNLNASLFEDTNIAVTYNYSTFDVVGESTYGITVFSTNWVEVTWSTPANFEPFNNGAPTLLNPDDSDNLYAKLRLYMITSSIIDHDGFADVDYVELSLWHNNHDYELWRVRYTVSTQIFSIETGAEYIHLSSSSSVIGIGDLLNITWYIKIDWDHFDMLNIDTQQFVIDISATSDEDWFESDWDVETKLDYSIMPFLSDNHGDMDTSDLQALGTIIYYGSSLHPLTNETDIWVIHDFSGSWSGSINALGEISVTGIGSSSTVRLNTYTFKIVEAGLGIGSADLFHTTSPTATFITDRIVFYLSGVADPRIDINSMGDVWFSARYEYSGTDIQSGLEAYLNGINLLTWDGTNSRWHYQQTRISPTEILYQISSATESIFGITAWVLNATDQSIIWDSLIITITDPMDQRIDVNTNATGIRVSAIYSYDSAIFNGTILLNNTVFLYSSVQRQYYTAASAFGDIYGISAFSANDLTWCIWDQIEVVSINTNITYLDPSEYARVWVEIRYDFDDAPAEDGNFSLKFEDLVHLGDGIWEVNVTRDTYRLIEFDTLTVCEAFAFGITEFDLYGNELTVYWDRLEFFESDSLDARINVGSTGFTVWSVKLQNADITISTGLVATTSDGSVLTFIDGYWRASHSSDVVGDLTFTIDGASLEGIDFFTRSTNDVTIIWDRINVLTISATTTSPEIETYIQIRATLAYEYDNTAVTDGSVTLWDEDGQITMVYNNSGGFWYANFTKVDIGNYTFYIAAVSGNQYGISVVQVAGNTITIEFVPAILPRLTPMMVVTISSGFGIILLISAVLVRRRYRVVVPYEIQEINKALEAMEKGEKVEPLDVRSLEMILFAELEPGLIELGLTLEEIIGIVSPEEAKETWVPDSQAELLDIMDEFKIPEYKQEIDEGELDISILSESESEEAWFTMLKEVRRIETEEGRKVPLTKEDWIEKISSEIRSIFFEEELKELDISELEHLSQLTPSEVEEIMGSISQTEDMYTSLEPEASAAAISSALSDRIESRPEVDLDETQKKERLFELLPAFVKEFFSNTWLEKLSSEEIEELLTIPEPELKIVIESLADSRGVEDEPEIELEPEIEVEPEPEAEPKVDLQAELLAELKSELKVEPEDESEVEPEPEVELEAVTESDAELEEESEVESEVDAEVEDKLEGEPEVVAETDAEPEVETEPEDTSEDELNNDLIEELNIDFEIEPEAEPEVKPEDEDEPVE